MLLYSCIFANTTRKYIISLNDCDCINQMYYFFFYENRINSLEKSGIAETIWIHDEVKSGYNLKYAL